MSLARQLGAALQQAARKPVCTPPLAFFSLVPVKAFGNRVTIVALDAAAGDPYRRLYDALVEDGQNLEAWGRSAKEWLKNTFPTKYPDLMLYADDQRPGELQYRSAKVGASGSIKTASTLLIGVQGY